MRRWWVWLSLPALAGCVSAPPPPTPPAPPPPAVVAPAPPAAVPPPAKTDLVAVQSVVPGVVVDLRYATTDNTFKTRFYGVNTAYLRYGTALKLRAAAEQLAQQGLRLKIWDAYRPRPVQWEMWKQVPDDRYVADPRVGSNHNRGAAVDVTLVDAAGRELEMPTGFDDFSARAHVDYRGVSVAVSRHRAILQQAMKSAGFEPLATEWWHFADREAKQYPLGEQRLETLD